MEPGNAGRVEALHSAGRQGVGVSRDIAWPLLFGEPHLDVCVQPVGSRLPIAGGGVLARPHV